MRFALLLFSLLTTSVWGASFKFVNDPGSPLLFSNPFISGSGSYEGALLIGEALQGKNGPLKNSGAASELAWVESLLGDSLPALPGNFLHTDLTESGLRQYTYTLPADVEYAYVMAKWGKAHNSSDHAVWLLTSGQTLRFELPNGLSHSSVWYHEEYTPPPPGEIPPDDYDPVRDPENSIHVSDHGSTALLLLGAVLPIFAALRQRSTAASP